MVASAAAAPGMSPLSTGSLLLSGIGDIANAWMQWKGLQEQRKENRKSRDFNKEMWEKAEGIRGAEWKKEFALKEQEVGASIDMMNFNKRQTFLDTVLAQFNRKPGLVNNFVAAQRGRK